MCATTPCTITHATGIPTPQHLSFHTHTHALTPSLPHHTPQQLPLQKQEPCPCDHAIRDDSRYRHPDSHNTARSTHLTRWHLRARPLPCRLRFFFFLNFFFFSFSFVLFLFFSTFSWVTWQTYMARGGRLHETRNLERKLQGGEQWISI